MAVVGSDEEHVGTVDCIRGDDIVLTKSDLVDPELPPGPMASYRGRERPA